MDYKKHILTILAAIVMIVNMSCSGQPKILGERTIALENFDFNLNINEFYPEADQDGVILIPIAQNMLQASTVAYYHDAYNTIIIKKDTIGLSYDANAPLKWILYRQVMRRGAWNLASLGTHFFDGVEVLTTLSNDVVAVRAYPIEIVDEDDDDEANKKAMALVQLLNNKYGQGVHTIMSRGFPYSKVDVYVWELDDRVIKFALTYARITDSLFPFLYITKKEYVDEIEIFYYDSL